MDKKAEQLLEQWRTLPLDGVWQRALIPTEEIPFHDSVRDACKSNYCGRYGKSWSCPPAVGEISALKAECMRYRHAFIFTTKHLLEDSFDVEGMDAARNLHNETEDALLKNFKGTKKLILGAGSCCVCKKCTYPDAPCRYPEKARKSVESYGINVVEIAKNTKINYNNGVNTVTYFSILLF